MAAQQAMASRPWHMYEQRRDEQRQPSSGAPAATTGLRTAAGASGMSPAAQRALASSDIAQRAVAAADAPSSSASDPRSPSHPAASESPPLVRHLTPGSPSSPLHYPSALEGGLPGGWKPAVQAPPRLKLEAGMRAKIEGLHSRLDLNGMECVVLRPVT